MNNLLLSINWNPNPELFNLFGISIRYYGLLWAIGIFFAYIVVHYQYRDKKIDEKKFEPLFFYCFFGILIGARLGHCLFYDPGQSGSITGTIVLSNQSNETKREIITVNLSIAAKYQLTYESGRDDSHGGAV